MVFISAAISFYDCTSFRQGAGPVVDDPDPERIIEEKTGSHRPEDVSNLTRIKIVEYLITNYMNMLY